MTRLVKLLTSLTPKQLAARKYKRSAKGRAAERRAMKKKMQNPAYVARKRQGTKDWKKRHADQVRVYHRIYNQTRRRLAREAKEAA